MDNIMRWFADPNAVGEGRPEQLVTIGSDAVARRECVHQVRPIEALERFADREDARGVRVVRQRLAHRPKRQVLVARHVTLRNPEMPTPGRIVVAEPVAPVVAMPAKLSLSFDQLEAHIIGMKTEIATAKVDWFATCPRAEDAADGTNHPAAITIGEIGR